MTAGNNGTSTPEDDDPFGYLYEDGRAAGAQPPSSGGGYGYPGPTSQRGVPRTSYNQVRAVGERQYGQTQGQGQQYGQQQAQATQPFPQQQGQGQQPYGQPNAHYAAPETQPGGAPARPAPHPGDQGHGGGRGRGPNTRGLLIGAIAVVAAVVIGIGAALYFGKQDEPNDQASGATSGQGQTQPPKPTEEPTEGEKPPAALPKSDAGLLVLSPGLSATKGIPGGKSATGTYVPLSTPGSSATWNVKVPEAGKYTLSVDYGVPGKDAKAELTVNGKPHGTGVNMKNYGNTPAGDWEKGWKNTYSYVNLKAGDNTFVISCPQGCEANLDQVSLVAGHKGS
ncbi:carbohydrate-binding protein [Streptomyces sp. NPDC048442]|uniref:CBM35 domain-containing protein n=1 Tax=Streptomyces sp. NPDC048442 TaxID=3154823 RepID=UPI00344A7E00